MNDHYYSEKPSSESAPKSWESLLRGNRLLFTSDHGVFSKKAIDFGTKLLIETFVFPTIRGAILDMGCGYGPIGLALAKSDPNREIIMADLNERAVQLAKTNAIKNRLKNVTVYKSNLFEQIPKLDYAAIVSNPPIRAGKKVVYELFEKARLLLKEEGELWIVIQKKQGARSAEEKLASLFEEVHVMNKKKGYVILCGKKLPKKV